MPFGYPLAMRLGGGPPVVQVEADAILQDLPLDKRDPVNLALAWGEAVAIANGWALDDRLEGNMVPARMMETLGDWEFACHITPGLNDTMIDRRAVVAGRFAGFNGNSMGQIEDICRAIAGSRYVGIAVPDVDITYEPGINPGPPGFEWMSTRCVFAIQLRPASSTGPDTVDLVDRLQRELQLIAPSWNFTITGLLEAGGFVPGVGTVGLTLL